MPVKSWKKSCTCIWKSIRQGVEAGVTESSGSRWKGWLIWWCYRVFWRWNMVSNSATLVKNRQVYRHTVTLLCKHAQAWVHMRSVVGTQMHAHWPLWLRPPGAGSKKLQECTQITACRQEEKWRRAGGVIKQESTWGENGRLLFLCCCPHLL